MDNLITKLYQSPKTIFTTKNLALLWLETNQNNLKSKISYYVKQGDILRLTRGVFAKDKNYNPRELGTSMYVPSYISFETVLRDAGVIFQHYDTIFLAGPWSFTKKIQNSVFTFRKLKKAILYNPLGISYKDNYSIASPERAFLDTLYLFPRYSFDNLAPIRWDVCSGIVDIYQNKQLKKRLAGYQKNHAQ